MTLSVKPFGCMPSSGVSRRRAVADHRAATRARSSARSRPAATAPSTSTRACRCTCSRRASARSRRWTQALAQYGVTREQVQAFLAQTPHYGSALYRAPHEACGSGADLIHRIGPLVGKSKLGQARVHAERARRARAGRRARGRARVVASATQGRAVPARGRPLGRERRHGHGAGPDARLARPGAEVDRAERCAARRDRLRAEQIEQIKEEARENGRVPAQEARRRPPPAGGRLIGEGGAEPPSRRRTPGEPRFLEILLALCGVLAV